MKPTFDENGWLIGAATAFERTEAWSLLSPEAASTLNAERLAHQARRFFQLPIELVTQKRYPGGAWPRFDHFELDVAGTRVMVQTLPLDHAPAILQAAHEAVAAIGGAGMDVLVGRAKRLWQVHQPGPPDGAGVGQAPLQAAAVLASLLLAPLLPPDENRIFGVKGARQRLYG